MIFKKFEAGESKARYSASIAAVISAVITIFATAMFDLSKLETSLTLVITALFAFAVIRTLLSHSMVKQPRN